MSLEHWELVKRREGNVAGAEEAQRLREKYGDVPLPPPEAQVKIERFTPGARKDLERNHFAIYGFNPVSIGGLRADGRPFWYITYQGDRFMNLLSRPSQIAIHPDPEQFYLPDSNYKSLSEQEAMIEEYAHEVLRGKKKIGGVEVIVGEAPDHVGVVFAHFDATEVRLHGKDYGYRYARTTTPTVGSGVAGVGSFGARGGLGVSGWGRVSGYGGVWAAPLVVPARE